jgi:hypothetical protein
MIKIAQVGSDADLELKSNGAAIEVRSADGSTFGVLRAGDPVGGNDVAHKNYVDTATSAPPTQPFQKRSLTFNFSQFTVDTVNVTETVNLGAVLPVAAVPVHIQWTVGQSFAGPAAPLAGLVDDLLVGHGDNFDLTQPAGRYVGGQFSFGGQFDGRQLQIQFTPATGQKLKSGTSAGDFNVTVYFFVAY